MNMLKIIEANKAVVYVDAEKISHITSGNWYKTSAVKEKVIGIYIYMQGAWVVKIMANNETLKYLNSTLGTSFTLSGANNE